LADAAQGALIAHQASAGMVSLQGAQSQMGSARNSRQARQRRQPLHPVVKRAQWGSDFELDRLVACHARTDAPYARGRLVITPLGAGGFTAEVI
jgi:hypothetical protein